MPPLLFLLKMFNQDFYPTPRNVIAAMVRGFEIEDKVILEPHAGKGDIVNYLIEHGAKKVIACEIEDELRKLLDCPIIEHDFLQVKKEQISHVNLIIMNPPFSSQEKHILHAINIAPSNCKIISLFNYEMYANPYTNERKQILSSLKENDKIRNLGACFKDAERATNIEVGMLTFYTPEVEEEEDWSAYFSLDESDNENAEVEGIISYNIVRDLVNRYVEACKLFDKQLDISFQMNSLIRPFFSSKVAFYTTIDKKKILKQELKKELQKSGWLYIFGEMKMDKIATTQLRSDINKFVEEQTHIPFTMKNIYKMLDIVIGTTGSRMDKALLEVFNKLTQHYHENRYGLEGWKTNSHYILNKKFILPFMVESNYSGKPKIRYNGNRDIIDDFIKALCFMTGRDYNYNMSLQGMPDERLSWGTWISFSGFFYVKLFKKGTAHFEFEDEEVWARYNQNIGRILGFPLPESFNNKPKK